MARLREATDRIARNAARRVATRPMTRDHESCHARRPRGHCGEPYDAAFERAAEGHGVSAADAIAHIGGLRTVGSLLGSEAPTWRPIKQIRLVSCCASSEPRRVYRGEELAQRARLSSRGIQDTSGGTIPETFTSFVGRQGEILQVGRLLGTTQLLNGHCGIPLNARNQH
jgi:hypothetical protein